jgi:hypothetical protein
MKTRLVVALVGLAISSALPTFAQQKETFDPQIIVFSNYTNRWDQYSPHMIGAVGKEVWSNGEWSLTWQAG